MATENFKDKVLVDGWKNRRKIAWISFIYCLLYPAFIVIGWLIDVHISDLLVGLSTAVYTLCGANLTWYFAFSSWEEIGKNKK